MRKQLIAYVFVFSICQMGLIAVLHWACLIHDATFKSTPALNNPNFPYGYFLPKITVWTLAGVRWFYLVPGGFAVAGIVALRKRAPDLAFLRILAALTITSLVVCAFVLAGLSCPLIVTTY